MDLSDTYPELKIVAVGAVNTARQVVQYDSEMRRRLAEIHVPLMNDTEIAKIVSNGCKLLGVQIDEELIADICHHSNGVASICHQLCSLMCEEMDIYGTISELDEVSFDYSNISYAISEYLELESDTIKRAFDNSLKLKDSDEIIYSLSRVEQNGAKVTELQAELRSRNISYKEKQIVNILENLITEKYGELIKYDEDSHKYSFSDPFYRTFALAFFKYKDEENTKKRLTQSELNDILNSAFGEMRKDLSVSQGIATKNPLNDKESAKANKTIKELS